MIKFQSIRHIIVGLIALLFFVSSCKSTKNTSTKSLSKKSTLHILDSHEKASVDFETYTSKLRLDYNDGKKQVSPSATLRLEKDKQLWLSVKFLGFTVAKAYITPNKVQLYEKLGRRYYEGDFSAISNFLGTTITFKSLQDLLIGQSMIELNPTNVEIIKNEKGNLDISPRKPSDKYSFSLTLDQLNYKVASYFVAQKAKQRQLDVVYESYQNIENKLLPSTMLIDAKSASSQKKLNVTFKKIILDSKLTFPFNIPSGYKPFRF